MLASLCVLSGSGSPKHPSQRNSGLQGGWFRLVQRDRVGHNRRGIHNKGKFNMRTIAWGYYCAQRKVLCTQGKNIEKAACPNHPPLSWTQLQHWAWLHFISVWKEPSTWKVKKNANYYGKAQFANFGGKPHFKLPDNTSTTVKGWKIRCRILTCFSLSCFGTLFWFPLLAL